jgi:hypothetical protein
VIIKILGRFVAIPFHLAKLFVKAELRGSAAIAALVTIQAEIKY